MQFRVATVAGVGLLGGSLGLALKSRGLAGTVRGVGRSASSLETARARGLVDETSLDLCEACRDADLVVLCPPAATVPAMLDQIRSVVSPTAVVTDVASTKGLICRHAEETWPSPCRFVGSHPMAGSEKWGPEHASAELYEGSVTIVATSPNADPDARRTVCDLWAAVGCRVVDLDAQIHDALVARTSHIPHIIAACIASLAADAGDVRAVAGGGFRDVTRVAAGRPEIWRDILLTNRDAILEGLLRLSERIDDVRRLLMQDAGHALEDFFREGQEAREKVLGP